MDRAPPAQKVQRVPLAFGSDFDELWAFAAAKSAKNQALVDEFLTKAAHRLVDAISAAAGKPFLLDLPGEASPDANQSWSEGVNSISLGSLLLRRLDAACLRFALWLTGNYITQTSGLGPSLPLPLLKSPWEFRAAALQLFASNMLPKASDPTGRTWDDAVSVEAMLMFTPQGNNLTLSQMAAGHGRLAFPLRPDFAPPEHWSPSDFLSGDPFPHLLVLYSHVLSDSVALVLAHEAAHAILGHNLQPSPKPSRSREDEVAADAKALDFLLQVSGFDLRAAALLFVFLIAYDGTEPLHRLSHPFAADRFGVLVATANTLPPAIIADLNAASQALRCPVPVQTHVTSTAAISAVASADLEYRAYLAIEQPVAESESLNWECGWELEVAIVLRDRVHPSRVFRKGNVLLSTKAYVMTLAVGATSRGGTTVVIELPPSWWLDLKRAALFVEAVSIREIPATSAETKPVFRCDARLTDDETEAAFRDLPLDARDLAALAAARAPGLESDSLALALLLAAHERFGQIDQESLKWLGQTLLKLGQVERAAQMLTTAMRQFPFISVGTRGLLASAKWQLFRRLVPGRPRFWQKLSPDARALYEESLDLAWRESVLSSDTPERKAAASLLNEVLALRAFDPVASCLLASIRKSALGVKADDRDRTFAYRQFDGAAAKIRDALSQAQTPTTFPKQLLGEALFAMAMHGDRIFAPAIACFEDVLNDDASFVPALTELAKIHLEQENFIAVGDVLNRAERISPAHTFLHYVRREYEQRREARLAPILERISEALDTGRTQELRNFAAEAMQIDPREPRAHYARAVVEYQAGDIAAACEAMEQSLALQGELFDGVVLLGQFLVELGAAREALERHRQLDWLWSRRCASRGGVR